MANLEVITIQDKLVVDSRLIAQELGIEHHTLLKTIKKYLDRLERKEPVRFEIDVVKRPQGGTYELCYCYLNEWQANLLMTFSRNTEQVLDCKEKLVDAFDKAKQVIKEVIPVQNEQIEALKLALALEQEKNKGKMLDNTMLQLHGKEIVLVLRGKEDQLVETEKPTIEVIDDRHNVKYKGQTCTQLREYIERRFGYKFRSGEEVKRILEKAEKNLGISLLGQVPRSITQSYIPEENLDDAIEILKNSKDRQLFLGE